ncbi:MAG: DUF4159 domain-containing protein [Azospirillum sp.]|nr:DUF4159 domain-containing protein [Azospirillum sp.]
MLGLGPVAFAAPWVLGALIVLPVLWWLLRVTPPAPRRQPFPAIELLRDLVAREETPARTPLWLILLRMVLVSLVILALAGPLLNPSRGLSGGGPILLVVDNGWAAARHWEDRRQALDDALNQAEREHREVIVLTTAAPAPGAGRPVAEPPAAAGPMTASDARRLVQGLAPQPWPADRAGALAAVKALKLGRAAASLWLSDGLSDGREQALATQLQRLGPVAVLADGGARLPHLLLPPSPQGGGLSARVVRAATGAPEVVALRLSGGDGRLIARAVAAFAADAATAEASFELPLELRNQAADLRLESEATVGAVVLFDNSWRRHPVGLVSGRAEADAQPLLSDLFYLERALAPFGEVRRGSVGDLLQRDLAMLVLADVGSLTATEIMPLQTWVEHGGVLVRFAGPRLAQGVDSLVPVRLRLGDRALGGALSWSEPARLAAFPETGPFRGLRLPEDVTVARQVLAEPAPDLADKVWARLVDGTPLVTAEKRGRGWVVLVHTTANPDWSNLALSGLFVEMLRRLTELGEGVGGNDEPAVLQPLETLDGLARLGAPPPGAQPIESGALGATEVDLHHPPGFYGVAEARRALNLTGRLTRLTPLGALPSGIARSGYGERKEVDLKAPLLAAAFALLVIDLAIALFLRGLLPLGRLGRRILGGVLGVATMATAVLGPARAGDDAFALRATAETRLAYVRTGDVGLDRATKAGLDGLALVLEQRTAVETGEAMAVNLETDELAFFPLLYWAVTPSQPPLSEQGRARVNDYLANGGTILIDTRDQQYGGAPFGPSPGGQALRQFADGLAIPPLAPVTPDHVLTRSFYLMQEFPGRYAGGEVWVEAREERRHDGVSSVILGGNDWAGAWAIDRDGRPMFATVPGGERQREMAYRFGVNLVMYALTGNYKADQVHVPAILERLGQ